MKLFMRIIALCLVLLLSLSLFACAQMVEDAKASEALCRQFMDAVMADKQSDAYTLIKGAASAEEFAPLWRAVTEATGNSKSYEMEFVSYRSTTTNGTTQRETIFEVVTDDGKVLELLVVTVDGKEGIAGLHFKDATAFAERTAFVPTVNIVLTVLSLLGTAFAVWMFIDCLRRPLRRKVACAILTLIHAGFSVTLGAGFGFWFKLNLFFSGFSIVASHQAQTITTTLIFPAGAILYLCLRRSLTKRTAAPTYAPAAPLVNVDPSDTDNP